MEIYLRDPDRRLVGALSTLSGGDIVYRWQAPGTFAVKLPTGEEAALLATPGYGIACVSGGEVLMSGTVTRHGYTAEGGGMWTLSGSDDTGSVLDVLGWPVPANALTSQSAEAWTMTGKAESVMKTLVTANMVRLGVAVAAPIAPAPRGATVTGRARMAPLLDVLAVLGEAGGLGWTLTSDAAGALTFDVVEPVDRSTDVLFSARTGTLSNIDYSREAPRATRVIVGGGGEGTARAFRRRLNSAAEAEWGVVRESFRDQRQTTTAAELDQEGDVVLADEGDRVRLALTVADVPGQSYGTHYRVGDIVPVEMAPGFIVTDRLHEARVSLDPRLAGRITPVVGRGDDHPTNSALRAVGRALRNLERSA